MPIQFLIILEMLTYIVHTFHLDYDMQMLGLVDHQMLSNVVSIEQPHT